MFVPDMLPFPLLANCFSSDPSCDCSRYVGFVLCVFVLLCFCFGPLSFFLFFSFFLFWENGKFNVEGWQMGSTGAYSTWRFTSSRLVSLSVSLAGDDVVRACQVVKL